MDMAILGNKEISEWLLECRTKNTAKRFSYGIQDFFKWYGKKYGKSIEEFIALNAKEMRHLALEFQRHLLDQGKPKNSVRSAVTALKCFCTYLDKPLNLRGKIEKVQPDVNSHVFRNGDLRAMFTVGNTKDKAIMATMCSLGWEIEGVLGLEKTFIERKLETAKKEGQKFVFFDSIRGKTGALRLGVLNPLAVEWLENWLQTLEGRKSEKVFDMTQEGVNKLLRRLARESKIITSVEPHDLKKERDRIHTHLIRKWVMSQLSRSGFNEWETKFVVGKAIPLSDSTYLTSLKDAIMEKYPKIYDEYLNINPPIIKVEVKTEDFRRMETRTRDLEEQIRKMQDMFLGQMKSSKAIEFTIENAKTDQEKIETIDALKKILARTPFPNDVNKDKQP